MTIRPVGIPGAARRYVAPRTFSKRDGHGPAWSAAGNVVTLAQPLTAEVAGRLLAWVAGAPVSLPALVAGTDYAIYGTRDGRLLASADFTSPAGEPAGTTRLLGGFHVALTGEILQYSLWDQHWRPKCHDPRGMVCINGMFWADIYLLGVNHHVDGTSRAGATIADGSSPPKIPAAYNGDGSAAYPNFTWFVAQDVLQAHGKRCPSWAEFSMLAFGVTEATAVGADPVTTKHDAPRRSKWGVEQATGNLWVWGADIQGVTGETVATSWQAITSGRGSVYTGTTRAVLLGANWYGGANSGSRAADWTNSPGNSINSFGGRGVCDHLRLSAER